MTDRPEPQTDEDLSSREVSLVYTWYWLIALAVLIVGCLFVTIGWRAGLAGLTLVLVGATAQSVGGRVSRRGRP